MTRTKQQEDALARSALPDVERLARLFARTWPRLRYDDFVSAGLDGVRLAALRWDDTGAPFAAYARRGIQGRMQNHVAKATLGFHEQLRAAQYAAETFVEPRGTDDAPDESPQEARERVRRRLRAEATAMACAAALMSIASPDPEALLIQREEAERSCRVLAEVLNRLEPSQRLAVQRHYVERTTLASIANELCVSTKTVQRLIWRAHERLFGPSLAS